MREGDHFHPGPMVGLGKLGALPSPPARCRGTITHGWTWCGSGAQERPPVQCGHHGLPDKMARMEQSVSVPPPSTRGRLLVHASRRSSLMHVYRRDPLNIPPPAVRSAAEFLHTFGRNALMRVHVACRRVKCITLLSRWHLERRPLGTSGEEQNDGYKASNQQ